MAAALRDASVLAVDEPGRLVPALGRDARRLQLVPTGAWRWRGGGAPASGHGERNCDR